MWAYTDSWGGGQGVKLNCDSAFKDMGPPLTQKYVFCLWQGLKKPPTLKLGGQNILPLLGLEKREINGKHKKEERKRTWICQKSECVKNQKVELL